MNKYNDARLNMFDAVISYCNNNTDSIVAVPAFQTAFTDFETLVGQIHDTVKLQANVITGITASKQQLRIALCQQVADLAATVSAFAINTNDLELKDQVAFSFWELRRLTAEMLVPTCSNIYDVINTNIKALKTYGITTDTLTDLQTAMDDYQEVLSSPRNAVSQRAVHSGTLNNLFKQAIGILKSQMDKVAIQFKSSDEDFYTTYKKNRAIVGPGVAKAVSS